VYQTAIWVKLTCYRRELHCEVQGYVVGTIIYIYYNHPVLVDMSEKIGLMAFQDTDLAGPMENCKQAGAKIRANLSWP